MNELMDLDHNMEDIIGGDYNCTLVNEIDRYNCCSSVDVGQIDLKQKTSGAGESPQKEVFLGR